jgi:hypothetical protein
MIRGEALCKNGGRLGAGNLRRTLDELFLNHDNLLRDPSRPCRDSRGWSIAGNTNRPHFGIDQAGKNLSRGDVVAELVQCPAGIRYRLMGFDSPETYQVRCDEELALGFKAKKRLEQLILSGTARILESGKLRCAGSWLPHSRGAPAYAYSGPERVRATTMTKWRQLSKPASTRPRGTSQCTRI